MKKKQVRLSTNDKLALFNNMAVMISAGIPILETVDSLLEDSKGSQQNILKALRDDLMQGKKISDSFAQYPNVFDNVTISLIKVAEEAGSLDTTLHDLTNTIRKDMEFSDKVRSAMIYPIFIMVVFLGVFLMILTFVVPKIATVFSRLKVDLPLPTQVMIYLSNLILTNTIPLILALIVFTAFSILLFRYKRRAIIGIFLSLPLISQLAREIDLTRFTRSLYLLLNSGMPITSALELSQTVVSKKEIESAIKYIYETVTSGDKFSKGLKDRKHLFPSIMIKMTEAGERSGSLESSMQNVSEYLDYQVSKTLKTLTALLEPLMLVIVGVLIGGMMMAIIAPIYGIISQVGGR